MIKRQESTCILDTKNEFSGNAIRAETYPWDECGMQAAGFHGSQIIAFGAIAFCLEVEINENCTSLKHRCGAFEKRRLFVTILVLVATNLEDAVRRPALADHLCSNL